MSLEKARFQRILSDAVNRVNDAGSDTMVVSSHLAQMRLFMTRQGVEFFAQQDTYGMRREFIRRVVDYNELPSRLEGMIDHFLVQGRGLFFFRPSKDLYRVHFFTRDQYRAIYDEDGGLEQLQIIYSFKVRTKFGFSGATENYTSSYSQPPGAMGNQETRWVYMEVFADRIVQTISVQQPQFDAGSFGMPQGQTRSYVNSVGFIPAVEVVNNRGLNSNEGHGEFDWLSSHILEHDRMVKAIRRNLQFFGSPTLVSSRPRHDLIEPSGEGGTSRPTMASNQGFIGLSSGSSRGSDPSAFGLDGNVRIPRIIANVEAADRVTFITPDPVPGDLAAYAAQYQEAIRAALGGVDDLSINSGATAYEVRTLYGRVATTAKRKARDLFEYGICRLFSMMILHEERIFRDTFAQAMGLIKPAPVIEEDAPPEKRADAALMEKLEADYQKKKAAYDQKLQQTLQLSIDEGSLPPNLTGLIPDGDPKVTYRFMGEIFTDGPQEILQQSIVCRNLQELGVSSIEALQHLFPEKTPEERAAMLTGYPFRMVEATQRSVGVFMDILRGLFQVPHPQMPDMPLAADPQLDLVPYIYRTLGFLQKELSYSGTFNHVDPSAVPESLSDADRIRAERGSATDMERGRQQRRDAFIAAGRFPAPTDQLAGGLQQPCGTATGRSAPVGSDADALLPAGGVLAFDPGSPYPAAGQLGQLGTTTAGAAGVDAFGGRLGAADLWAPTNAGLPGAELLAGGPAPAAGNGARKPGAGKPGAKRTR